MYHTVLYCTVQYSVLYCTVLCCTLFLYHMTHSLTGPFLCFSAPWCVHGAAALWGRGQQARGSGLSCGFVDGSVVFPVCAGLDQPEEPSAEP